MFVKMIECNNQLKIPQIYPAMSSVFIQKLFRTEAKSCIDRALVKLWPKIPGYVHKAAPPSDQGQLLHWQAYQASPLWARQGRRGVGEADVAFRLAVVAFLPRRPRPPPSQFSDITFSPSYFSASPFKWWGLWWHPTTCLQSKFNHFNGW